MPSIEDMGNAEFWAAGGWMAPWLKQVDPAYWPEMIQCIGDNLMPRKKGWRPYVLTEEGQSALRIQLCTRISQASDVFVPWLEQHAPLKGLRVLEIGCGSGSSTAGLAQAGARVTGIDIKANALTVARRRMALLGFEAQFIQAEPDWLERVPEGQDFGGPYDLVVCYAMLEHLQIRERLNLLGLVRQVMARDGAMLATFETPNRFAPYDWHSTKLAFSEMLPDELAYEYARLRSPSESHPAHQHDLYSPEARTHIYRRGRGVSWHEFEIVFGLAAIEVVLDGYSPRSQQKNYRGDAAYEAALAELFAKLDPPVPRAFCRPSLELLIRLRARPEA
ncbi:MAG TPA: methyltransferase domain-containing protein [Rhizomicrobium sp.]|nr:methyltransferase domain-containing protein [Rhizomicrobium sp.]